MDKTMKTIRIDGAMGEGGGQVLRSALTLAMLQQVALEITHIRGKRKRPGLLRQHLTCVRAAQQICSAEVQGDELGSSFIRFVPGKVQAGDYHFAISTAGSTVLVCQTILLPLALSGGASKVQFTGGTHNDLAPSTDFLQASFLPILGRMGITTQVQVERLGFNPAGGGHWQINIQPVDKLSPLVLEPGQLQLTEQPKQPKQIEQRKIEAQALVCNIGITIAEREIKTLVKDLGLTPEQTQIVQEKANGPGNSVMLKVTQASHCSAFELHGQVGVRAENIAKRLVGRLRKFLHTKAAVEEYLADQLLLPLLVAGEGGFTTVEPSLHTLTNIEVIRLMTGKSIDCQQLSEHVWRLSLT